MTREEYERAMQMHRIGLAESMGDIFTAAAETYSLPEFAYAILHSRFFPGYFEDLTVFSQLKYYALEILEEHADFQAFHVPARSAPYDEEHAYWLGYLFAEWFLVNGIDPSKISTDTINWLYSGFEVLHTVDTQYCYDLFVEDQRELAEAKQF